MVDSWIHAALQKNLELVFVLDYTHPNDLEKFTAYFSAFSLHKLKIIIGNFGSPGRARNEGIVASSAKWIAFWDGDDSPNVIDFCRMVETADATEYTVAMGGFAKKNYITKITKNYPIHGDSVSTKSDFFSNPGIWRFAFKKNALREKSFQNLSMGEDLIFLALNVTNFKEVFYWSDIVYSYSSSDPGSLTSNASKFNDGLSASRILWRNSTPRDKLSTPYIMANRLALAAIRRGKMQVKLRGVCLVTKYFYQTPILFWQTRKTIFKLSNK
jgi:glycosyltransferase involved in cell wall biosynthesis